jgi:cell division protein FtsN
VPQPSSAGTVPPATQPAGGNDGKLPATQPSSGSTKQPPAPTSPSGSAPTSPSGTAPPKPPAGETPASTAVWVVHVASYKTEAKANVEIANLRTHGFQGRAVLSDLGSKGVWYRVLVGPYATRAEADAARTTVLALPGYDFAQVRRVPRD